MSADEKITLLAFLSIKEEREGEFVETMKQGIKAVRAEEGCLAYRLYRRKGSPLEFVFFEQYRDKKALEEHVAHLVAMFGPPVPGEMLPAALGEFLEKPAELILYDEVDG